MIEKSNWLFSYTPALLKLFFLFGFSCVVVLCIHVCLCAELVPDTCEGQKRMWTPLGLELTDDGELICGCLELNLGRFQYLGPLKEPQVLLTVEPSL